MKRALTLYQRGGGKIEGIERGGIKWEDERRKSTNPQMPEMAVISNSTILSIIITTSESSQISIRTD